MILARLLAPVSVAAAFAATSAYFPSRCASPTAPQVDAPVRKAAPFVEKVTGLSFSDTLLTCGKSLKFVGAGDRKKAIIGPIAVNVYAVGLYVDEAAAKATAAKTPDAAQKLLVDSTFTKALKIVMARSVSSQKIGDALVEQIEPRVKGTDAPLDKFKSFFQDMQQLDKENEIIFTASGDTLAVQGPSGSQEFASKHLCNAMFDIYLGDDPVSTNGKKSMLDGFVALCLSG
mmetsp:Transcript_24262/g.48611  ORF Transcript_24262/g.48611 Transcript_24262/m.48611 type:complete len:231 (-) Transcript_24262:141-833(-)